MTKQKAVDVVGQDIENELKQLKENQIKEEEQEDGIRVVHCNPTINFIKQFRSLVPNFSINSETN